MVMVMAIGLGFNLFCISVSFCVFFCFDWSCAAFFLCDLATIYDSLTVVKYLLEDETVLGVWNEFAMLKGRMDMEKEADEEV